MKYTSWSKKVGIVVITLSIALLSISAVTEVNYFVQIKGLTVIDCRSFSCLANGATDATTAIQQAMDAASVTSTTANPTEIVLPAGQFLVSSPLLLRRNGVILRGSPGEGLNGSSTGGYTTPTQFGGTVLVAASTHVCPVVRIDPADVAANTGFVSTNVRGTAIQNINIDVSAATNAGNCLRKTATVSSSGTTVTASSGSAFTIDMQGTTIQYGTASYIVGTVSSATSLTLLTTPLAALSGTISWANPVIDIRSVARPPTFHDIYIRGHFDMAIRVTESFKTTPTYINPYPSEHIKFYNIHAICCSTSPFGPATGPGLVIEGANQIYLDHSAIVSGVNGTLNSTRTLDVPAIEIRSLDFSLAGGGFGITDSITGAYPIQIRVRGADYTASAANGGSCVTTPNNGGCAVTAAHFAPSQVVVRGHFGESFNRPLVIGDETTTLVYPARGFSFDDYFDLSNHFIVPYDGTGSPGPGDGSTTPVWRAQVDWVRGGEFDQPYAEYWNYITVGSHAFNAFFKLAYDPVIAAQTFIYLNNNGSPASSNHYEVAAGSTTFAQLPVRNSTNSYDGIRLWCYDCQCSGRTPLSGGATGENVNWSTISNSWVCGN